MILKSFNGPKNFIEQDQRYRFKDKYRKSFSTQRKIFKFVENPLKSKIVLQIRDKIPKKFSEKILENSLRIFWGFSFGKSFDIENLLLSAWEKFNYFFKLRLFMLDFVNQEFHFYSKRQIIVSNFHKNFFPVFTKCMTRKSTRLSTVVLCLH